MEKTKYYLPYCPEDLSKGDMMIWTGKMWIPASNIHFISFLFNDFQGDESQEYILDLGKSFSYEIISGLFLINQGIVDELAIYMGNTVVGGLDDIYITSVPPGGHIYYASTPNIVTNIGYDSRLTLSTKGVYRGDVPTMISGKLTIKRLS